MPSASSRRRVPQSRRREFESGASKSLQKAIRILLHMGQYGPELRISEIAASLRLNKTTVYRLLGAMEKFDLIQRDPEGEKYRLGLKLHDLGTKALKARTLQSEARRFLADLARVSNEAVSLAVPASSGVVCVERFDSPAARITVRTPVGSLFPAHCTAAGKAVLAYLSEQDVAEIVQRNGLPRFTVSTHVRIDELKNDLRRVRQRGYALDEQELERGFNGVAAPIILQDAHVVGAVGIAGPTQRFQGRELGEKIDLVREAARKIAANLGDQGDWPGMH